MESKDIISVSLSGVAFCFSIYSLWLNWQQKKHETARGLRLSLTQTLSELSALLQKNIEMNLAPKNTLERERDVRRALNTQRRFLVDKAEFIMKQIRELLTDIDFQIIATAVTSIGDYEKADIYWKTCTDYPCNNVYKAYNFRGYGRFKFLTGNFADGRKLYQKVIELELPKTDHGRRIVAETHLLWAYAELEQGFKKDAKKQVLEAEIICKEIRMKIAKRDVQQFIQSIKRDMKA